MALVTLPDKLLQIKEGLAQVLLVNNNPGAVEEISDVRHDIKCILFRAKKDIFGIDLYHRTKGRLMFNKFHVHSVPFDKGAKVSNFQLLEKAYFRKISLFKIL